MDYDNIWRSICDAVWVCTTDKYINDPLRVPHTLKELEKLHVPSDMININIMPHGTHKTGHLSCTANHIEAIKKARNKYHKRIFIVEDDISVHVTTDINKCLETLHQFITDPKNHFDILYVGCFAHKMQTGIHRYRIRKASCYATHGYIINIGFMDMIKQLTPEDIVSHSYKMLENKEDYTVEKSFLTTPEHPSIDVWLILLSDNNFIKSYCIYPNILYQNSIKSTIAYKYTIEPAVSTFGNMYFAIIILGICTLLLILIPIIIMYYRRK